MGHYVPDARSAERAILELVEKGNIQEGAHFSTDKQALLIRKVAASLASKGLTGTGVSAADDNSIDETVENLLAYDHETLDAISQINTHSYNGSRMEELRELAGKLGKPLWMSEYGTGGSEPHSHEDMSSVQELAERIMFDLKVMKPAAWVYWQAVEDEGAGNNWGFIHAGFTGEEQYAMTKQYYGMAQFSKFIRPGATIIPTDDGRTLAAYDEERGRLVLVVRNELSEKKIAFDLSGYSYPASAVAEVYQTSADRNLERLDDQKTSPAGLEITAADNSVTTVVIDGVSPNLNP